MGNTQRKGSRLIIIKLGGSVITYKDSPKPKARKSVINRLSEEIEQIYKQGHQIILVHGGGSFGHPLAKKYNLTRGLLDQQSCIGFAETIQAMINLNQIVIKSLHSVSLPAITLSPHTFMTQTNNRLDEFDISLIRDLLNKGFIPVLYGDPVIDKKLGCSILSGDVIIPYFAKMLHAQKVIFLSDVDGIFDDDPKKNPKVKLIKKVTNKNLKQVLRGIKSTTRNDVTGGMTGKILTIKKELSRTRVVIVNGFKKGFLLRVVNGDKAGTELYFD